VEAVKFFYLYVWISKGVDFALLPQVLQPCPPGGRIELHLSPSNMVPIAFGPGEHRKTL
jgi:hypothetical protein